MFNNYLSSIDGISIFPIIGLILFFSFFVICLVWIMKIDKSYLNKMENLPLDLNETENNQKEFVDETNE